MEDIKNTIGRNIRILRRQKSQTLQSLSKQIGITHQQLSRIENGSGTSTATLEKIAAVLDVDMKVLIDEPETNLQKSIQKTINFIPDKLCNEMYARLYTNIIKPTNDTAIDKFIEKITEQLLKDKHKIRNIMCSHVGNKEYYQFTSLELQNFCQLLFADFVDYTIRLSKVEHDIDK